MLTMANYKSSSGTRNGCLTLMNAAFILVLKLFSPCVYLCQVSYNAAGVLSHMASDGEAAWTIQQPPRQEVLAAMVAAIQRWDLSKFSHWKYRVDFSLPS